MNRRWALPHRDAFNRKPPNIFVVCRLCAALSPEFRARVEKNGGEAP